MSIGPQSGPPFGIQEVHAYSHHALGGLILSSRPPLNPPLEKLCLPGLDFKSFNRLLGQRSHDLVNLAAVRAGRFNSQTG